MLVTDCCYQVRLVLVLTRSSRHWPAFSLAKSGTAYAVGWQVVEVAMNFVNLSVLAGGCSLKRFAACGSDFESVAYSSASLAVGLYLCELSEAKDSVLSEARDTVVQTRECRVLVTSSLTVDY